MNDDAQNSDAEDYIKEGYEAAYQDAQKALDDAMAALQKANDDAAVNVKDANAKLDAANAAKATAQKDADQALNAQTAAYDKYSQLHQLEQNVANAQIILDNANAAQKTASEKLANAQAVIKAADELDSAKALNDDAQNSDAEDYIKEGYA
ncbi:hypothetical protein LMB30_01515, partial [Limosilactobacillus reuteri]|nr:hypothetical protein [Limosilactobacillus reuteri]